MFETLIRKITQQLDYQNIPYMIIGGQAVLLYGRPRLTRDIDFTLGIDVDDYSKIEHLCRVLKLNMLVKDPESFAAETRVLPTEDRSSKIRVDFIFSFMPFERQAIQNAKSVQLGDVSVKFASCEDVIIHKLIAGRAIDVEDTKIILLKNRTTINIGYIEKWLAEFSQIPEYENVLIRWTELLRDS